MCVPVALWQGKTGLVISWIMSMQTGCRLTSTVKWYESVPPPEVSLFQGRVVRVQMGRENFSMLLAVESGAGIIMGFLMQ